MTQFFWGSADTILYFLICASAALLLRFLIRIPDEIFRKLLHTILLGSLPVYVFAFDTWYCASASALVFAAVVFPILWAFEHIRGFSKTVTERRPGELKASLLLVFSMFAAVIAVFWGVFGDRLLVLAAVYAWGPGDAAAALIGKRFGRHHFPNSKKSIEGSAAMLCVSAVTVCAILLLRGGLSVGACLLTATVTGAVCAAVELYTPGGYDTVSCPAAAAAVLLPMLSAFGGL